jgi:hypothetical protein
MLQLFNLVLGAALLFIGRKLYWLLVGIIGFTAGILFTSRFLHIESEIMVVLIGLGVGILFALLAVFIQSLAIGAAGFFGGGYILLGFAGMLGLDKGILSLIVFILGGVIGVLLVAWLFDWALITISSLAGASMLVEALNLQRAAGGILLLILVIVGVSVQGAILRREKQPNQSND